MKTLLRFLPSILIILFSFCKASAQLYPIELNEKINHASLIVEGKVIDQQSFWDRGHHMIYTANKIKVYKIFKGGIDERIIEVLTQGGTVGTDVVTVSDLLQLEKDKVGMLFCELNGINLRSPSTNKILYDVYSSDQGFLCYDLYNNEAYAPFASYKNIESNLYNLIQKETHQQLRIVDNSFNISQALTQNRQPGPAATILSFSPTTVHGGALDDSLNNTLIITGTGFGATPGGNCAVRFKNGDDASIFPTLKIWHGSYYVVSWSDTKIVVKVPDHAATGKIGVQLSNGSIIQSSISLDVYYSVLNGLFKTSQGDTVYAEQRLMNANGSGGYTYQYSTNTFGSGVNFATSPAKDAFERALATWKSAIGINFIAGANTTSQQISAIDGINNIVFDNTNTGVPRMGAGVLEATYSYATVCYSSSPFLKVYPGQKVGFDILVRNNGISLGGSIVINYSPCFPATGTYDGETIFLHELGHAAGLAHINDDAQGTSNPYVNPSKVMHYAIRDYVDRRSLDVSAYQGALYSASPQHNNYGGCTGLFSQEMTLLSTTIPSNDNCPSSFPINATPPNTVVNFDLVHTMSNKFVDPQYTDVNCANLGSQVTNNAYYAIKTGGANNGFLSIDITGYTTTPPSLDSCSGQGVRITLYDVNSCPAGQNFPAPLQCRVFDGNGAVSGFTGLQPNHNYLLYFDGLRNTKATFTATFNGSALPLTLSKFTGEFVNGKNLLYIDVLQALNVKSIIVEKSYDGIHFTSIGTLPFTAQTLLGKHIYFDAMPFTGNNYYRLQTQNNDGSIEYSNIILLKNEAQRLVYVYPNPVKDVLHISINSQKADRYMCFVYDISGKLVVSSAYELTQGSQNISVSFRNVAKGAYVVKILDANDNVVARQNVLKI